MQYKNMSKEGIRRIENVASFKTPEGYKVSIHYEAHGFTKHAELKDFSKPVFHELTNHSNLSGFTIPAHQLLKVRPLSTSIALNQREIYFMDLDRIDSSMNLLFGKQAVVQNRIALVLLYGVLYNKLPTWLETKVDRRVALGLAGVFGIKAIISSAAVFSFLTRSLVTGKIGPNFNEQLNGLERGLGEISAVINPELETGPVVFRNYLWAFKIKKTLKERGHDGAEIYTGVYHFGLEEALMLDEEVLLAKIKGILNLARYFKIKVDGISKVARINPENQQYQPLFKIKELEDLEF
jgi:hypothetical protein